MRLFNLKSCLLLIISFSLPYCVWAGPATDFLKIQVQSVRVLIADSNKNIKNRKKIDQKLMNVISPLMNFPDMSRRVIGKRWTDLKQGQKTEFISLFQDLVFTSYMKRIRSADEGYQLLYEDESEDQQKGQKVYLVESVAKTKTAEIELIFALKYLERGQNKGGYEVFDIEIDSLGLVENYKEQFIKIIKNEGFDTLLKKMRTQLERVKK
jgi:phospholipid transport system substrate-binding protein